MEKGFGCHRRNQKSLGSGAVSAEWWVLTHSGHEADRHGRVKVSGLKTLAVLEHPVEVVLQKASSGTLKAD